MALKDLFGKKSLKPIPSKNLEQIREEIESAELLRNKVSVDNKFIPRIDYSNPENFSFYGSAVKYYEEAMMNIHGYYPFDGSNAEKLKWENEASYLDLYIFENDYPKSVGHASIGKEYSRSGLTSNGYFNTNNREYILFSGGPNTGSFSVATSPLYDNFAEVNSYDTEYDQENNLSIVGTKGTTVEFWLKKDAFSSNNESDKQVVVDIWNNKAHGQPDYCRFRVEIHPNISGDENKIVAEIMSGTTGVEYATLPTGITVSDNKWHHYAISAKSEDNKINLGLYVDGTLATSALTGSSITNLDGSLQGYIGSLITSVSGTHGGTGYGKLSGSIDEFRFWKKARSSKEIGENWRAPIHGGSNTDTESGTDLTVYYKFNEGIYDATKVTSYDEKVLDYSGRTTIGRWDGYTTSSRTATSAYEESGILKAETKDPIMYSTHPDVSALNTRLTESGSLHDGQNNSNLFKSLPSWIVDEDDSDLEYLTQIMSKYFDELHLQIKSLPEIKNLTYPSGSEKAFPYGKQLLSSQGLEMPELFVDSNILEYINNRSDKVVFEEKLNTTKNMIYQNIYNNLVYLYRSKGTSKSIRNLTRCFGINEDLLKLNMYSNNSLFTFEENYNQKAISKRYADFNYPGRFDATIYQMTSSTSTDQRSYITGSSDYRFEANTLQGEFIFPKKIDFKYSYFFETPFLQSSLFGVNGVSLSDPAGLDWPTINPDITVYAIKDELNSPNAYFKLTSSYLGVSLTSSVYRGVYDNEKWNLAARIKPKKYPYANMVSGSNEDYTIEFYGVNHSYDLKQNEFSLSADVTTAKGQVFFDSSKRVFVGARRTNSVGSVLDNSDVLASSIVYWNSYITDEEIQHHSLDPEIHGPKLATKGVRPGYDRDIMKADSVILQWDFADLKTSDANGSFTVSDSSSGSLALSDDYGAVGKVTRFKHPGQAYGFPANSSKVVNKEYIPIAKKNLPEIVNGDHMVKVLSNDDEFFSRTASPEEYFFSLEKSMYATVSEAMLSAFSTIKDMNNLVGEPVNKYRAKYKEMEKLRQSFFQDVENEPDVETFLEYYKWIDDSITEIIKQFIPLSADLVDSNANVIESHILERNKYQHQYPALEERMPSIGSPAKGAGDMKYAWSRGHAPVLPSLIVSSDYSTWVRNQGMFLSNTSTTDGDSGNATIFAGFIFQGGTPGQANETFSSLTDSTTRIPERRITSPTTYRGRLEVTIDIGTGGAAPNANDEDMFLLVSKDDTNWFCPVFFTTDSSPSSPGVTIPTTANRIYRNRTYTIDPSAFGWSNPNDQDYKIRFGQFRWSGMYLLDQWLVGGIRTYDFTTSTIFNLQAQKCQWWNQRAEKYLGDTSPSTLDSQRQNLFNSLNNTYKKERDKAAVLVTDNLKTHSGNSNKADYTVKETTFGSGDYLLIESSDVVSNNIECEREIEPEKKIKFGFALKKV